MTIEGQSFITSETGPDFPVESLLVSVDSGLTTRYNPGNVRVGAAVITITSGTLVMTDNATNYVFINPTGTVVSNTTGVPACDIPLADVVTGSGTIGTIIDKRTFLANGENHPIASASSEGESQTTSTNFQQKVRLNLTVPSISDYTIMWSCGATIDDESMSVDVQVELDDSTLVDEFQFVPKKKLSSVTPSYPNFAGVSRISLTSGTHTIDMDFKSTDAARSAAIRRARIIAIRG